MLNVNDKGALVGAVMETVAFKYPFTTTLHPLFIVTALDTITVSEALIVIVVPVLPSGTVVAGTQLLPSKTSQVVILLQLPVCFD
ncbi:MAG: hypothetical protein IGBAC_0322 [Ignavibacteriae bacterium]|nr:MAG: hypothetical protein IGBAC_0322 [Ignavibacteriota bacterium]